MFDLVCQLKSRVFVTFPKTWTSVWGWEWEVDNTYRRGLQELHTTRHASDSMEMKKAGRKRATKRCIIWWSRSHWLALGWLSVFDVWKETLTARCSVCKISLMTGEQKRVRVAKEALLLLATTTLHNSNVEAYRLKPNWKSHGLLRGFGAMQTEGWCG